MPQLRRSVVPFILFALGLSLWFGARPFQMYKPETALIVKNATDFAERAVPGWRRAEAAGRVIPLQVSAPIPDTGAQITLEKAWHSGSRLFILYTVSAADGKYLMPIMARLNSPNEHEQGHLPGEYGQRLRLGGFSAQGFHHVMGFRNSPVLASDTEILLRLWQRAKRGATEYELGYGGEVVLPLYLGASQPVEVWLTYPIGLEQTWQGRKAVLEEMAVGFNSTRITGYIELLTGETEPSVGVEVFYSKDKHSARRIGGETYEDGAPGRYRFALHYDPPNNWPTQLKLIGPWLGFQSPDTYELQLPWAEYRAADRIEVKAEDRVSLQIHDTELSLFAYSDYGRGIHLEDKTTRPKLPRITFGGGIGSMVDGIGTAVIAPGGEVVDNYMSGGGTIWDQGRRQVQGHYLRLLEEDVATGSWTTAESLLLKIAHPTLQIQFDGSWELTP